MLRRPAVATLLAAVVAAITPAAVAVEGPGYGGTADELAVVWQPVEQVALAAGARPALMDNPDLIRTGREAARLVIRGVGFRGRSEVELRVGDGSVEQLRVDESGSLDVELQQRQAAQSLPGTSVIAIGRAPSGAARTLVGAVPPLPSGLGPADIVPWVVVAVGGLGSLLAWRRRSDRVEPVPHAADGPDVPGL